MARKEERGGGVVIHELLTRGEFVLVNNTTLSISATAQGRYDMLLMSSWVHQLNQSMLRPPSRFYFFHFFFCPHVEYQDSP